jgi:glutamate-1-semialdehyde 2,1-aminomutase
MSTAAAAVADANRYAKSIALYERAKRHMAGGVNSSFRLGGVPVPLFYARAEGAYLFDVDGNRYIDYVAGMGPTILGHAPRAVTQAVAASLADGQLYAGGSEAEIELAEMIAAHVPCAEMVRLALSGTEADQAALRLARAVTGRRKIVKFEGHYHGWLDSICVSIKPALNAAGPESEPVPVAESTGMSPGAAEDLIIASWNDVVALERLFAARGSEIAGVIMEPIMCNSGTILPAPGYLEAVQGLCRKAGALLIFDEVITGFRVGLGGAQKLLGVTPDLAVFAKAVAGGFPMSVLAGKRAIMERLVGHGVMHGGTYNGHAASVAAAIAAIKELARDGAAVYRGMEALGKRLMEGLKATAAKRRVALQVQGLPTVFTTSFSDKQAMRNWRDVATGDAVKLAAFNRALQDRGVRVTSRGCWFISAAHTSQDVDRTLEVADAALATMVK